MGFAVSPSSYDAFMGRFSRRLAVPFADLLGVQRGEHVVDVGCGTGALSEELLRRGARVTATDPSEPILAGLAERLPDVQVQQAPAEVLPFPDDTFDAAAAQLVVQFMADPVAGLAEMARVVRPGGAVVACVWDNAGDGSPLRPFWRGAMDLDPTVTDERAFAGSREGEIAELMERAGLEDVRSTSVATSLRFGTFSDWWEPFTFGVGPPGEHMQRLDEAGRQALADRCAELLGPPPFEVRAHAWAAVGHAPSP